jgi:Fe-S-cluster containining protein
MERAVLEGLRAGGDSVPQLLKSANRSAARRGEPPLSPDDLYRRLWSLARELWFELDALPAYDRRHAWRPTPATAVEVLDTSRAAFLCTGCGRCCDHTDIGPIGRVEAARIASVEPGFGSHVTWLDDEIGVLAAGCERCPYKRPDGLCALHAEHGVGSKPLVCRQFPYRFTRREDRVEVTLDAECWQLTEALAAGRADPEAARRDVQAVWELSPILEHLPPVCFSDPFTPLSEADWCAAVEAFERALDAGASPTEALLELLQAAPRRPPAFLDEALWAQAFGPAFRPGSARQRAWAFETLGRMLAAWTAGAPWREGLGAALQAGVKRLADGVAPPPLEPRERELFVTSIRTHLDSRNVLKKDNLELGVLALYWRTRVADAARGPISAIDTLVASNKLPKDRRLGEYFRQNQVLFRRLAESPVRFSEVE